ncbi:MAG TPA: hypothetical protein VGJ20_04615 [Xanthobacteraceae bacterium]
MSYLSTGVISFFAVLLAIAVASCASNGGSKLSSSQQEQVTKINAALDLARQLRFEEAEAMIQPLIHAKRFGRLPSAEQYRALSTAAKLAFTLEEPKLEYGLELVSVTMGVMGIPKEALQALVHARVSTW